MLSELEEMKEFTARVPRIAFHTVFDVGANVGQSMRMFRALWPDAKIFAFEPVRESFDKLQANFKADPRSECFRLALGDQPMRARMLAKASSTMNKILEAGTDIDGPTEEVDVETGTRFCAARTIETIDYLKIDAEGFDLKACQGFEPMLRAHKISAIQIEVGMQLSDPLHLPLHTFLEYLHPLGYRLFKIHNQHVPRHRPIARRGNAVFISLTRAKEHAIKE
jgi:FkbM family methyltransferase